MITKNKHVTVSYELRTENGAEPIEIADASTPLEFICGQGQTLEYFEMNLLNLNTGNSFDFNIPAANAYGEANEEMIVELPRNIFEEVEDEELKPGSSLPMQDSLGRHLNGTILTVDNDTVKMDFNHPLAGKDLFFKGKVLDVRDATDAELEALTARAHGGCNGCGSGDSGCGSGCSCGH